MTREYLKNYQILKKNIERSRRKLDKYLTTPLKQVHGTVQSSMKCYPYVKTHLEISGSDLQDTHDRERLIRQLVIDIANNLKMYEEMEIYIDMWLEDIDDIEMKEIVSLKYCDGLTDREIAEMLSYERSTITKRLDSFFHTNHIL